MRTFKVVGVSLFLLFFQVNNTIGQSNNQIPWDSLIHDPWVDSIYFGLSLEDRISQLFMVDAYSNKTPEYEKGLVDFIAKHQVGGVIFLEGNPVKQAELTNKLQDSSKIPLLVAMDAEWGLAMQLDDVVKFPYSMTLGAIEDKSMIYDVGAAIARHCVRLGVHINFAPVVDINNNPQNPVINFRSFGENREEVAARSWQYAKGLQDHGVLAVAKHFPGHGDTDADSHLDLPVIPHDIDRLDSLELFPFKYHINKGTGGIMIAHLNVPNLNSDGVPTSLSEKVVTGLLRDRLKFGGVAITDALNMQGVTKQFKPGEIELKSLMAGNDILLFSQDVPKAVEEIKKAVINKIISEEQLENHVRKVLATKRWVGLNNWKPINIDSLVMDLHLPHDDLINQKLAEASVTLLENKNTIPVQGLDTLKVAVVSIGRLRETVFQQSISRYTKVALYNISKNASRKDFEELLLKLNQYNLIIAGLHTVALHPKNNFGITENPIRFIEELSISNKSIISVFGNPYLLASIPGIEQAKGLLVGYQETYFTQLAAAEAIFGGIPVSGKLPVSIGEKYNAGYGLELNQRVRFKYTLPEEEGIETGALYRIDSLAKLAIQERATPGCQVLVAKNGKIIFRKSYGYHTYDSLQPVENDHLYDLASVTKVSGALPCLMKLYEEGKFDLDASIGDYIPYFHRGNKKKLSFREILAHQSGMASYITYWRYTVKRNGKFKRKTFSVDSTEEYNIYIVDDLYLHKNYQKKIYKKIKKSKVGEKVYLYSGLTFILFPQIIENISGETFEDYLYSNFYYPLGAYSMTFKPYEKFSIEKITPTEYDSLFRKRQIHGTVHDEAASMMDGKSSNAGLFANANDLAKLFQMYANYGEYGGKRYLKEETLKEFTRYQYPENNNRRGLAFDKPSLEPRKNGNTAKSASPLSFGHSGFTGTFAWADPEYNLVYIFLSNRVYTTRENQKLYQMNFRTDILEVVYNAMNICVEGI